MVYIRGGLLSERAQLVSLCERECVHEIRQKENLPPGRWSSSSHFSAFYLKLRILPESGNRAKRNVQPAEQRCVHSIKVNEGNDDVRGSRSRPGQTTYV